MDSGSLIVAASSAFLTFNLTLNLLACQPRHNDDPDKVKRVLLDYFDGIENKDFQKMKDVTTPDFVLFEDGKVFNNDSVVSLINSFPKFSLKYTFNDFHVKMDQDNAHMWYIIILGLQ